MRCYACGHLEAEHGDDVDDQCLVGHDFLDPRPYCTCLGFDVRRGFLSDQETQ